MTQYTKGPWDYFVGKANGRGLIRIETGQGTKPQGEHIASLVRNQQSEANARLIAAAPDLLEALIKARKFMARCNTYPPHYSADTGEAVSELAIEINAAIAKARV